MGRRCCVAGCASTSRLPEHHGVTYHSFPLDQSTRTIWIRNTRLNSERQITKSVLVCSRHFRRADFQPQRSGKYLLKQKVFPTVFPWGKVEATQVEADLEFLKKSPSITLKPIVGKQQFVNTRAQNSPVDEDTKATVAATVAQIMAQAKANENTEKINYKVDSSSLASVKFEPVKTFASGVRLEAQDFDGVWHSARVVEVDNDDREILIKFEKTGKNKSTVVGTEEWIPMDSTRLRQKISTKSIPIFTIEEKCMARWSGPRKFPGTIKKILPNDTYEVLFDDGYVKNVRAIHINKMQSFSEEGTVEEDMPATDASPTMNTTLPSSIMNTGKKRSASFQSTSTSGRKRFHGNKRDWPLLDMSNLDLASLNLPEIPKDGEWTCHWVNDQPIGREGYLIVGEHRKPTVIVEDWRLPSGWIKHMYQRSNVLGKWDVILVTPAGKRFRSKSDLKIFLEEQGQIYNPDIYDFSIHRRRAKDINCYVYTPDYVPFQPKSKPFLSRVADTTTDNNNSISSINNLEQTTATPFLETPIAEPVPPIELLTSSVANEDKKITQVDSEVPKQLLESAEVSSTPTPSSTPNLMVKEDIQAGVTESDNTPTPAQGVGITPDDDGYALIGGLRVQIIDNLFRCPQDGCSKNFRKENHLQIHVKHYHQDLYKLLGSCPKMLDLAEKRTHPSKIDINEPTPKNQIPNQQFFAKLHQQDLEQTRSHRRNQGILTKAQTSDIAFKTNDIKFVDKVKKEEYDSITLENTLHKSEIGSVLSDSFAYNTGDEGPSDDTSHAKRTKLSSNASGSRKSNRQRTTKGYLTAAQATVNAAAVSILGETGEINFVGGTDSEETRHSFNATPDQAKDTKKRKCTQATIIPFNGLGSPMTADSGSAGSFPTPYSIDADTSTAQTPQYIKENGELIKIVSMRQEEIINCLCGYCEEDGLMIQCELCLCWQHGFCNGIVKESQVPDKYVCYICRNPQCFRDSLRFKHDQDWLYDGKLPLANYHLSERTVLDEKFEFLRKSHALTGNLLELKNYIHSLRVKINIANNKCHPKLYLWDKSWDMELDCMKSESKKELYDNVSAGVTNIKLGEQIHEVHQGSHSRKIKTDETLIPTKPTLNIPQPEAPIDPVKCQQRLLEHIKVQQELVWSRLNEIETIIDDLECSDTLEDLKNDDISVVKDVLCIFINDLDNVKQIAKLNTLEHIIVANKETSVSPTPAVK